MAYRTIDYKKYDAQTIFGMSTLDADCWTWQGSKYQNGYAKYGDKGYMVHRIAYELAKSDVPPDMCLDHLCKNRSCINPDHLEVVTLVENVMRGQSKHAINARKTHCLRGHELSGANLYLHPKRGTRHCRACSTLRNLMTRKME